MSRAELTHTAHTMPRLRLLRQLNSFERVSAVRAYRRAHGTRQPGPHPTIGGDHRHTHPARVAASLPLARCSLQHTMVPPARDTIRQLHHAVSGVAECREMSVDCAESVTAVDIGEADSAVPLAADGAKSGSGPQRPGDAFAKLMGSSHRPRPPRAAACE